MTGKAQTIPMIDDVFDALKELREIQREIAEIQSKGKTSDKRAQRMVADGRVFNIAENREWWSAALEEAKVDGFAGTTCATPLPAVLSRQEQT